MYWLDAVGEVSLAGDELILTAGMCTDWFIDPATLERTANAPVLVDDIAGDFQLSARVEVDFAAMFDAGVLFVHHDADVYAKLCFELAPAGERTVVSVVTRSVSDDANGPAIQANDVWLRVSRIGDALAFHWSVDGALWHLLRYFRLMPGVQGLSVGFCAQSPTGQGCTARFSQIECTATTLGNVRDGG